MATPYDTNVQAADNAFKAFAAKIKEMLAAAQAGVDYADNAGLLAGLTVQEIVDMAATASGQTIAEVQTQLDDFILEMSGVPRTVATTLQAEDPNENNAILTPLGFWHALNTFWTAQVGASPATLDEIHEIAAAIQGNQDAITAIETWGANKVDKTVHDADIANLQGQIDALVIPAAATQVEVDAGTVADKYVAPNTLKVRLDALRAAIEADVNVALASLKSSFDSGLAILNGTEVYPPAP